MTTTASTTKPAMPVSPVTPAVLRKAWEVRKELADKYHVPTKFVGFKDCVAIALGRSRKAIDRVRSCWGDMLYLRNTQIDLFILSDDCPVVFFKDDIKAACPGIPDLDIMNHLAARVKQGLIIDNLGFLSANHTKRPYPHGQYPFILPQKEEVSA